MTLFLKVLLCELVALLAPLVCLVYRKGWFNTPDDPSSPHGLYETKMRRILAKYGRYWSDWWWLGVRNRAYGLRYALKPNEFKGLWYEGLGILEFGRTTRGRVRVTRVLTRKEWAIDFGRFHVLYGYRMTPIYNELVRNYNALLLSGYEWDVPFRPINMDARPLLSIRSGKPD